MTYDLIAFAEPYLLIFARISATFFMAPGLSDTHIPVRYRLLFALALSLALRDLIPIPNTGFDGLHLVAAMIQETLIGCLIGFIARLLINMLDVIGNILSLQIGLGNAMVFNPSVGGQAPIVGHFVVTAGVMLFFAADLHHEIIKSLLNSYAYSPINLDQSLFKGLNTPLESLPTFFNQSFKIACQLSLPFLILGILFQFMLGLLNRVVPSIQIFFITLPLQILLGILLMGIILSVVISLAIYNFGELYSHFLPK